VGPEVILGCPPLLAAGNVSLHVVVGMTHWALTQAQDVHSRQYGSINDEHRRLLLWASLLKERTTYERAKSMVRQEHLDKREELMDM
jgi:hypothetical protein